MDSVQKTNEVNTSEVSKVEVNRNEVNETSEASTNTSDVTIKDIFNQVNQTSAATDTFKNIMGLLFKDQETGTSTKTNVLSLFETILSSMMNKQSEEKSDKESETDEMDHSETESDKSDEADESDDSLDSVESETETESEVDSDQSYDSDSTDLDAEDEFVYLLHRGDHKYRYTTTYEKAMKSISTELRHFMKKNILSFYRVEKDESKTVVFERYPNTLDPYDEKIVFQIYIIKVKKY
jgi:hypothetical protein